MPTNSEVRIGVRDLVSALYARYFKAALSRGGERKREAARANTLYRISVILSAPLLVLAAAIGLFAKNFLGVLSSRLGLGIGGAIVAVVVWISVYSVISRIATNAEMHPSWSAPLSSRMSRWSIAVEIVGYCCIVLMALLIYFLGGD